MTKAGDVLQKLPKLNQRLLSMDEAKQRQFLTDVKNKRLLDNPDLEGTTQLPIVSQMI
jgi:hypothetical protein